MAYDQILAGRVSEVLKRQRVSFEAKGMIGGLCYMVNGKMAMGIMKDSLMVRIAPELYDQSLNKRGVRQMDFRGKILEGYLLVDGPGLEKQGELEYWVTLCLEFNPRARSSKKASQVEKSKAPPKK